MIVCRDSEEGPAWTWVTRWAGTIEHTWNDPGCNLLVVESGGSDEPRVRQACGFELETSDGYVPGFLR